MRYVVEVRARRTSVDVESGTVREGGRSQPATLHTVEGTPVRLVTLGDEVWRVVVRERRGGGAYTLWIDGYLFDVEALDERTRTIRDLTAASATPAGPTPLVAPMPGLIVRVHVKSGDRVTAGQGLVVMEAMKMENELRAPGAGVVRAVRAEAGQTVEKGATLVELD